ncbi:MAG: DUF4129 domain-containing protein [Janthinobacterium lividum]
MPRRRVTGLLLLGGLALGSAGRAGRVHAAPTPLAQPTTSLPPGQAPAVRLRQPAAVAERLAELRGQRDFNYAEPPPADAAPNAWSRFWRRILGWIFQQLNWVSSHTSGALWSWLFYGLLAGAVVFVVLKLLQVDLTLAFGRSPHRAALGYETSAENIHEVDFATRLREAEEAGNLRLAVRLGYLALLKQLTDQQLIDWQPDKTNQAYVRELATQRPAQRVPFAELTRQFEYVWYGELPLPMALYREVRASQLALGQQLAGARPRVSS